MMIKDAVETVHLVYDGANYHVKSGHSAKEWAATYYQEGNDWKVLTRWGRLGRPTNAKINTFSSRIQAREYYAQKTAEKLNKGYKEVK